MKSKLLLNVLLTKKCNLKCKFCVEDTCTKTPDSMKYSDFIVAINRLVDAGLVSDVSLLGGEPLYFGDSFTDLLLLIKDLKMQPFLTTNGSRLYRDENYRAMFINSINSDLKCLNVSIPSYDHNEREALMGESMPNYIVTRALEAITSSGIKVRLNVPLIKGGVDSMTKIDTMTHFAAGVGAKEVKFNELTARSEMHDFVKPAVRRFCIDNYIPIPVPHMATDCHEIGGTHYWLDKYGVSVYFNASPDISMAGGRDKDGNYYHRVLFNDGKVGHSWRRADGVVNWSEIAAISDKATEKGRRARHTKATGGARRAKIL